MDVQSFNHMKRDGQLRAAFEPLVKENDEQTHNRNDTENYESHS
jgi:hypothetical protein